MNDHHNLRLRDRDTVPTDEILEQVLGKSYTAYEAFQDKLPSLKIEQDWQWYTPHKAWFAKGQHCWTTPRGTRKEKNLYWLHVFDGYFSVAVWFKEKDRSAILLADVGDNTKKLIRDAETMGKVATFPVVFDMFGDEPLADVYTLIECKKDLERRG